MAPIPVSEDSSVGFLLHLNFLGVPQAVNGPMEIGESISIQCLEPGNFQIGICVFNLIFIGYTFDINFMHKNRIYPVEKLIGTVSIQIYFISFYFTPINFYYFSFC